MLNPPLPCRPPFWAKGGHTQTLLGNLLPSRWLDVPWERLNLKLPDGDSLRIRMARGHSKVVVYLFHGLGGSADSPYIRRAAGQFWQQGHSVLAINHRGAGEGRLLAEHPYHLGSSSDLAALIQVGHGFFPEHLHIAIGFSLSATALLLLLGRDRHLGLAQPDRAIAVNPVVDLEKSSHRLATGFNRIYDHHLLNLALDSLRERKAYGLLGDTFQVPSCRTLRDLDEAYTAQAAGFRDRDDYYEQCSCGPYLQRIRTPTVILGSEDDPLCSGWELRDHEPSPSLHLHLEPNGGHLGYLGLGVPGHRWLDYALNHYVKELIQAPTMLVPPEFEGQGRETQTAFLVVEKV